MTQLGISVHRQEESSWMTQAILRLIPEVAELGVKLEPFETYSPVSASHDVVIFEHTQIDGRFLDVLLEDRKRLIVLERSDSANPISRTAANHPVTIAILKSSLLNFENVNKVSGRFHGAILGSPIKEPKSALTRAIWRKFKPILPFGMHHRMSALQQVPDDNNPREIDIHFVGRTDGYETSITNHRKSLLEALRSLKGVRVRLGDTRFLSGSDYRAEIVNSRVVVSPWGHGEMAFRDYEALLAGCTLIKPNSSFLHSTPEILRTEYGYFECAADWSNLGEVVNRALTDWGLQSSERLAGRDQAREIWAGTYLAKWLSAQVLG